MPSLISCIKSAVRDAHPDRVFILFDPAAGFDIPSLASALASGIAGMTEPTAIPLEPGEENKTLAQAARVLSVLSRQGASRRSILVCVGGGMTTDLGGFVASVFKRGIRHINVPTTLLGAVDAAIGGKTGVDFLGLKNEIGTFHAPLAVIPAPSTFRTLPPDEILSGLGEMVKTLLIGFPDFASRLSFCDPDAVSEGRADRLVSLCARFKEGIVAEDPCESGLRKILNFGHTAGHALESLMLEKGSPVPHGIAIAHGILISLLLSERILSLPRVTVSLYASWLRCHYPPLPFSCADYPRLWALALHDKKNSGHADILNFVLLAAPGEPRSDIPVTRPLLEASLDLYQELQGR